MQLQEYWIVRSLNALTAEVLEFIVLEIYEGFLRGIDKDRTIVLVPQQDVKEVINQRPNGKTNTAIIANFTQSTSKERKFKRKNKRGNPSPIAEGQRFRFLQKPKEGLKHSPMRIALWNHMQGLPDQAIARGQAEEFGYKTNDLKYDIKTGKAEFVD